MLFAAGAGLRDNRARFSWQAHHLVTPAWGRWRRVLFAAPFRPQLAPLLAVCALPFPAPLLAVLAPLLFVLARFFAVPASLLPVLAPRLAAPQRGSGTDRWRAARPTRRCTARPNDNPPRGRADRWRNEDPLRVRAPQRGSTARHRPMVVQV